ncbi:multidrug transporter EmrE-like cation transporter [Bradyrhizobium sp. LM2.7]
MAWLFLLIAGLCEPAWAIGLKYTEGFSRLLPTIGTVVAMVASIGFLGLALKSLPGRYGLCGVDRHWHYRHYCARCLSFQ